MSIATENFVKKIYQFEQTQGFDTKPGSLAKSLGVTNAAATDMARKLAAKKIVNYEKYRELKLTGKGKKMALSVLRKHRLWEAFLFKVLHLSLHEIHQEAELLEHQTSDYLAGKISNYLGNPTLDPHGDPIPNEKGEFSPMKGNIFLSDAVPGKNYIVSRISGFEKDFFNFCRDNKIEIGTTVKIEKQYQGSSMTEISIGRKKLVLNKEFTRMIYVQNKNY